MRYIDVARIWWYDLLPTMGIIYGQGDELYLINMMRYLNRLYLIISYGIFEIMIFLKWWFIYLT